MQNSVYVLSTVGFSVYLVTSWHVNCVFGSVLMILLLLLGLDFRVRNAAAMLEGSTTFQA